MPSRTFDAWPQSVAAARTFVVDLLHEVPVALCETAALLVSELATNSVLHADVREFAVEIEFFPPEGRLWIGVTDTGAGRPIVRSPSVTAEHGRGLRLVATLADRWGARRRRGTPDKTVWFELTVPTVTG